MKWLLWPRIRDAGVFCVCGQEGKEITGVLAGGYDNCVAILGQL